MPSGVGKVAYAQNVVSYFITFAGLGMASYGVREIGKCQDDRNKFSKKFLELFIITLFTTLVFSIGYYGWIVLINPFEQNKLLYLVAGLQLILGAFNVDWFYQGMEEYKFITSRSIITKLISLVFMFVSVRNSNDIVPYALMSSIALAGNNIINVIHIRKYIDFNQLRNIEIRKHLKPLVILLSATLTVELYTKLDTTMLGIMTSDVNVGYYNYATKITIIIVTLASAMSATLLPRLSYYIENGSFNEFKRIVTIAHKGIITITLPAVVGLYYISEDIVRVLFGEAFAPATITIKILSFLIIVKAIGNLYGVQVLMAFGAERYLFYSTLIGAISNIIINYIMIPIWKENGAALASVISESIVCFLQVYYANKCFKINIPAKIYCQVGFSCSCMALALCAINYYIENSLIRIVAGIIGGFIVFYIISLVVKNEMVKMISSKITRGKWYRK